MPKSVAENAKKCLTWRPSSNKWDAATLQATSFFECVAGYVYYRAVKNWEV